MCLALERYGKASAEFSITFLLVNLPGQVHGAYGISVDYGTDQIAYLNI